MWRPPSLCVFPNTSGLILFYRCVDESHVLEALALAEATHSEGLRAFCLHFIERHYDSWARQAAVLGATGCHAPQPLAQLPGWEDLTQETIQEIALCTGLAL